MRIIAGEKKGTKLLSPKMDISRPIIDRVKESLFSVLYKYNMPEDKRVADLFSGVGSLGLEALSRGAKFVTFVEKDHEIAKILNKNIEKCGFTEKSRIIKANAFKIAAPAADEKYDLVFVDPPYAVTEDVGESSRLAGLLDTLAEQITNEALVIVRTHKRIQLFERYGRLKILEKRQWGSMTVTILGFAGNGE